jgi:hypothetical protein
MKMYLNYTNDLFYKKNIYNFIHLVSSIKITNPLNINTNEIFSIYFLYFILTNNFPYINFLKLNTNNSFVKSRLINAKKIKNKVIRLNLVVNLRFDIRYLFIYIIKMLKAENFFKINSIGNTYLININNIIFNFVNLNIFSLNSKNIEEDNFNDLFEMYSSLLFKLQIIINKKNEKT